MDVMIVLVGVSELVMGLVLRVELVYSEVLAHLLGMHLLLLESQASCELLAVVERDELVIVTVEPGVVDWSKFIVDVVAGAGTVLLKQEGVFAHLLNLLRFLVIIREDLISVRLGFVKTWGTSSVWNLSLCDDGVAVISLHDRCRCLRAKFCSLRVLALLVVLDGTHIAAELSQIVDCLVVYV